MPRPCEDVIIISDAEEGELLEVDDDDEDADVPEGSEREEGEIPDDDTNSMVTLETIAPCQDKIDVCAKNNTIIYSMPISFEKPFLTNSRLKYGACKTNGFSREHYGRHINIKKTYSHNKYHIVKKKLRRKCQKVDESSDSDTGRILKKSKFISLGMSKKCLNSSLKSRLSEMLKCSNNPPKSRKPKNGIRHEESAEEMKDDRSVSNNVDHSSDNMKNDDMSDEDLDILRELALKSKTQRVQKQNKTDNPKNIIENNDLSVKDVDKELEELRLDALKSAILKKAYKRKRIKNDKKEKKAASTPKAEEEVDLSHSTLSPISLGNSVGNLMYDYGNSNYEYYNSFFYNDIEKSAETTTADKENTESQPTQDSDEDEESLRKHLLSTLKRKKEKHPDSPQEVPYPKINIKHDDSNLIIRLGGSDTESDCEETKNLALMHAKLINQNEFQRNLEYYLKEARQTVVEKMNYETTKFGNGSTHSNSEANKIRRNQWLDHLAKVEEIKMARKEALKKSVENRKLQKRPILQRKISVSSQNGDSAVKKDSKRILKPSMLINRRPSLSIADRSPSIDKGQKALGQQLIFIRKKIAQHSQTLKRTQSQMKDLQKQKDAFLAQIRSVTFSLKTTENALNSSQQSLKKTFQQLSLLQKHHLMLQNRFMKISPKINEESPLSINNNIKERVVNEHPSVPNIIKNTEKTLIISVPNTKPTNTIEKSNSPDQSQPVSDRIIALNSSRESEVSMNSTLSEEVSKPAEIPDQQKPTNRLIVLPLNNKTEKGDLAFTEYKTPLTGMKSNQSWIGDPNAILCPFDVSGCCKDASCNYYHPKICKM